MSQRSQLEKRVNEILERHLDDQRFGSPDSPNLLGSALVGGCALCSEDELGSALHSAGSGAVTDFLMDLLEGEDIPEKIAKAVSKLAWKLLKKRFHSKGKGAVGGCGVGCPCQQCRGGAIGEKQKAGLAIYQEFMNARKEEGLTHKEALALWREKKCNSKPCKLMTKASIKVKPSLEDEIAKLPAPPAELMEDYPHSVTKEAYSDCMKMLGIPANSDSEQQQQDQRVMDSIRGQIDEGIKGEGLGRKLSDSHRAALMSGQEKYRRFMAAVKEYGLPHKDALALYRELKAKKGGDWFDDFSRGFMLPVQAAATLAPAVLPFI